MEETLNFVNFIKEKFTVEELKIVKFMYETDILTYSMATEKVREGDKLVEKPTNVLEMSFLKLCAKRFDDSQDMFEKIFLFYIGYALGDCTRNWKLNLNNLDSEFNSKCSYCIYDETTCPYKLLTYIMKCISDNKFDAKTVFKLLVDDNVEHNYSKDEHFTNYIVDAINDLVKNPIDIVGAEMLLVSDAIKLLKEENGKLYYKYIDFNVKYNSFFYNLLKFYRDDKGIDGELDLSESQFSNNFSYIFDRSPIEIAAYIKYLCAKNNVDEEQVIKALLEKKNFKESKFKDVYYNQYVHFVNELECADEEKEEIISIFTYIRNYYYNENLPYIHFNIALYTKNSIMAKKVVHLINKYSRTLYYILNKGTIWVDTEMLVKRTKDSNDMLSQVEKIYTENDLVIFENIEKIKKLNEYRVDAFFTAIEKFNQKIKKSMTIMIESEDVLKGLMENHPQMENTVLNGKIHISEMTPASIRDKIVYNLDGIIPATNPFSDQLIEYVEGTYIPEKEDENVYINRVYNQIVFDKFKKIDSNNSNRFEAEDTPKIENTRSVDDILVEINSLVGLSDIKESIRELIKYLDYSKKIDERSFANLNMIFKGNSGTGKTTVARLLAELYYKLGFIKENKVIEVTSKDIIGSHLGETAPKTQAVIDTALDGVLFIDEAYTIMASKGSSSSNYPAECMATICKAMELYKDRLIVIFAGYTREMNDFINENQGLMARIGYEFEFPDFSKTELMQIFENEVNKNNFSLEDGVKERIEKIVVKNKIGRNFGNARFVMNLFDRLVMTHSANYTDENNLRVITKSDVEVFESTKKENDRTVDDVLNELNSLIGLQKVKETINGFVSVIELNKKLDRASDFNMHMIFKGNAGTGKTTVARLLSEVYYNLGYIKRNKLVEVQSQDLIGEFLGQTGPKTQAVIESALDGVLFIDEAYAIMEHNGMNASYSAECVATLLKAMEDYQGRLIIIFAGYTEEMKKFRDLNPGLKSRIGYEIDFEDYSVDDLMKIFDKKVADKGYKTDDKAREKVRKILEKAKGVENFGNGRFVENTVQKIIIEHAMKTRSDIDEERLLTFMEEDIPEIKAEESRNRIGF